MLDHIFAAVGIAICIACCAFGWWIENGPERKKSPKQTNEKDNE